jgi:integrase
MPQAVTDALTAWRAEQLTQQLACPAWAGTGLVFTDRFGRPVSRQKIHYGFRQLCKAAGIGTWQPRELRHTFVSVMSASGVDIEVISGREGASSPSPDRHAPPSPTRSCHGPGDGYRVRDGASSWAHAPAHAPLSRPASL